MVKASFHIPVNLYLDYYLRYERILKENCKITVPPTHLFEQTFNRSRL